MLSSRPNILSTSFSFLANLCASLSDATSERLKTEIPLAFLFSLESASVSYTHLRAHET